jgi:transcriptional regulator with XRE-family HTH domain
VNAALLDVLAAPFPEVAQPAVGELWRLEWDGEAMVVGVTAVQAETVSVAAIDTDPREDDPDPAAVSVPAAATVLACALRAWPAAPVHVPRIALDRRLAPPLDLPTPDRAAGEPESWGLQRALRRLRGFADGIRGALTDPGQPGALGEWLRSRGVTRTDLVRSGLRPRAASMILQGRQQPSAEDLLRIARAADADPLELRSRLGTFPGGLLAELHRPRRRAQITERAVREGVPVSQLRREAAAVMSAPRATRTQRGSAQPDWAALVDEFFA